MYRSYLTAMSAEEKKTVSCATDPGVTDTVLHKVIADHTVV